MGVTIQKYLPISFALDPGDGSEIDSFTFPIRPEELTRTEPSRVFVVNSLGGAWVDSFGKGLATLTLSGHTGWGQGERPHGGVQFAMLRDDFINKWHVLRKKAIDTGDDPDIVRLIYIDALNNEYVADVVPMTFTLRRSKSHPLLMMYTIVLTVVSDTANNPYPELLQEQIPPSKSAASVTGSVAVLGLLNGSLGDALKGIGTLGVSISAFIKSTLGPALALAQEVIRTAELTKSVISAAGQLVIQNAALLSASANTMFKAIGSVTSIPLAVKGELLKVKGALSNLACNLTNGFNEAIHPIDYTALYGASNCSSTTSGRAASEITLSGKSAFETLIVSAAPRIFILPSAAAALADVMLLDVTLDVDQAQLAVKLDTITAGVSFA